MRHSMILHPMAAAYLVLSEHICPAINCWSSSFGVVPPRAARVYKAYQEARS
jgi:hypothetical protein